MVTGVRPTDPVPTVPAMPTEPTDGPLLDVSGLKVHIPFRQGLRRGLVRAVDGVSFTVDRGRTLGLVGESGCGKTTTARSTMRLIEATAGRISFRGKDITHLGGSELREMRRYMQIVFQDPYSALNGRLTVKEIVAEPMKAQGASRAEIEERVPQLLETVGLQPRHRNAFPHQFSGGQRQRIGTARALATSPDLLVLDEPVSALDVSVQAQVVNLFHDLQTQFDMAMILISHDLSVVKHLSDEVAVMYLGQIVEYGPADEVLERPRHPYTEALISAAPGRAGPVRERIVLTGEVPSPIDPPSGCRFRSRCWKATDVCQEQPPLLPSADRHAVACWHPSNES